MAKKKKRKKQATKRKPSKKKAKTTKVKGSRVNGLPAKQWMFCQEYLIDLEAKAAAKRAGYSEKTCEQIGWQLLQKPEIQQTIELLIEERAKRCGVHADRVVWELACCAFSDITEVLTFGPKSVTLKESSKLTEKQRRAIGEVKETVNMFGPTISFKMHSKIEALKTLAQHLGMTKGQVDVNIPGGGEAKIMFFPSNGREITQGEDDG